MRKRFLSLMLVCIMVLGMLPVNAFAADVRVATKAELTDAIAAANDGGVITLTADIDYGTTVGVDSIGNVTIKGAALTNGIETYNCGDAAENVIGTMENVTIDAVGTGMLLSAPCGTATNCSISGGVSGIEIWIKGTYSASLELIDCDVEGGEQAVYAHDEFSSNPSIVNSGTITLTSDEDTTFESEDGVPLALTIARISEDSQLTLPAALPTDFVAKVGNTYFVTVEEAAAATQNNDTIIILKSTSETLPVPKGNNVTYTAEEGVVLSGGVGGSYWNKSTTFDGLTFEGGKGIALTAGVDGLTYTVKNCTFDGVQATAWKQGVISLNGKAVVVIENNTITNVQNATEGDGRIDTYGQQSSGVYVSGATNVTVSGNTISGIDGTGINVVNPTGTATITDNEISDWGTGATAQNEGRAIRTSGGTDVKINGNVMIDNGTAQESYVKASGAAALDVRKNYWNGNDPIDAAIFEADDGDDLADLVKNYYTDEEKSELEWVIEPAIEMDGEYFLTIKDALDTLTSADTTVHKIKVLQDLDIDVNYSTYNYPINYPILINGFAVELDLNGKTITADWSKYTGPRKDNSLVGLANGGKLTVIDSSEEQTGTIRNMSDGKDDVENRIFWLSNAHTTKEEILTIEGGTFIQEEDIHLLYVEGVPAGQTKAGYFAYINGGNFQMIGYNDFFNSYDGREHETIIAGGTFNIDPTDPETKFPAGYIANKDTEDKWTIQLDTAKTFVAKIDNNHYETLAEAVTTANTDGTATIELLDDVEVSEKLEITGDVTIEGEYTITRADAYAGTLFEVASGAELTLDSVTVDGAHPFVLDQDKFDAIMDGTASLNANKLDTYPVVVDANKPIAENYMFINNGSIYLKDATIQNHSGMRFSSTQRVTGVDVMTFGAGASVTMDNSVIKDCASNNAGAIFNVSKDNVSIVMKNNSRITNNFGITSGAMIRLQGSNGTFEMESGSSIDNNYCMKDASAGGMGIILSHTTNTLNISDSAIKDNKGTTEYALDMRSASVLTMDGSEISGNNGGIRFKGTSTADLGDSVIGDNGDYNLVFFDNATNTFNSDVTIEGPVFVGSSGVTLTISDGQWNGYFDIYGGGKVFISGGAFTDEMYVEDGSALTITGGTFDYDPSEWVADGYRELFIGNGKWTVGGETATVRVTFDTDGGTSVAAQTVTFAHAITNIPETKLEGYDFLGWYLNGEKFDFSTLLYEDIMLTARWSKTPDPTYTIKNEVDGLKLSARTAEEGEKVYMELDGIEIEDILVLDRHGDEIEIKEDKKGYYFKMPYGTVTIELIEEEVEPTFIDVDEGDYYFDAVEWAVENGITNGMTWNTFGPDGICTRAQVVTFLWRAAGCPEAETSEMPFVDVAPDAYYYDAVLWAVENGITKGMTETTFAPNATVTRGQTVTFLWRAEGEEASDEENVFTDVAEGAYYNDAVLWAVENGITNGTSAATFSPESGCTRGQIVTFLYRTME